MPLRGREIELKDFKKKINELSQKIKFLDEDLSIVNRKNLFLKTNLAEHQSKEEKLKSQILDLKILVDQKDADIELMDVEHQIKHEKLEKEIAALKAANATSNAAIQKLTMFNGETQSTESK
jgi:chromosome segregation ATPase